MGRLSEHPLGDMAQRGRDLLSPKAALMALEFVHVGCQRGEKHIGERVRIWDPRRHDQGPDVGAPESVCPGCEP